MRSGSVLTELGKPRLRGVLGTYGCPHPKNPGSRISQRARRCDPGGMFDRDTCLACGEPIAPVLRASGSLRCHDCRDRRAPLRAESAEQARFSAEAGALLRLLPPAPPVLRAA